MILYHDLTYPPTSGSVAPKRSHKSKCISLLKELAHNILLAPQNNCAPTYIALELYLILKLTFLLDYLLFLLLNLVDKT